jgi:hypothetical protein
VFDVIATRAKVKGGEDFPGVLGKLMRAGSGRPRALANVAAVVTDQQAENPAAVWLHAVQQTYGDRVSSTGGPFCQGELDVDSLMRRETRA